MRFKLALSTALILAAAALFLAPPKPVRANADQQRLGITLFHERGCEHCHGVDGTGGELGPDLSTIGKRWSKPQIEHQIHDGGGGMPAFAEALQPDEITALVEYLHKKKKAPRKPRSAATTPAPAPPAPPPA